MFRKSKAEVESHDKYARKRRSEFRKHKRGLPSTWRPEEEVYWHRNSKDWAWLIEPESVAKLSFPFLKKEVRKAGLTIRREYIQEGKNHPDWPSAPFDVYPEWVSYRDLFGLEEILRLTLPQLKKAVKKVGVKTSTEYRKACKKQERWFSSPDKRYKEWIDWDDLFGRDKKNYLTLSKLKKAVKKSDVSTPSEYRERYKEYPSWPASPKLFYDDWKNWPDLFGRKKIRHLTLPQLRKAVRKAGVKSSTEYYRLEKTHLEWPNGPSITYPDWVSMSDLLGVPIREFLSLSELKKAVKKARVTVIGDKTNGYRKICRKHWNWPSAPNSYYKNWVSWDDFFGRKKRVFLTLPQLKRAVRKANIKKGSEYKQARKRGQKSWPAGPEEFYANWVSWFDLLGKRSPYLEVREVNHGG